MSNAENSPSDRSGEAVSFEASLEELQRIVGELEEGEVGLEESLVRFEKGIRLLRNCYRILEEAEQKIEILAGLDEQGVPLTAPFDGSATTAQAGTAGKRRSRKRQQPAGDSTPDDAAEGEHRLF